MASGDVVNTASRLQSAAPTNGILVDETTYHATAPAIEYREAEPVQAKGKADPVAVWEAVEPRWRFGVDVEQRGPAELVGRSEELDLLTDALSRARRERASQLVTLVGVPGIGKSRLVFELSQAVDADPELIYWRQGRSLPYGEGVTFWALSEMVKGHASILESDNAEKAEVKLRAAVGEVISDPVDVDWATEHLRPLVGLAGEAEVGSDRRAEIFAACSRAPSASASSPRMDSPRVSSSAARRSTACAARCGGCTIKWHPPARSSWCAAPRARSTMSSSTFDQGRGPMAVTWPSS